MKTQQVPYTPSPRTDLGPRISFLKNRDKMAHGPKGKARAEVGQREDWEEDVEDLGAGGGGVPGGRCHKPT